MRIILVSIETPLISRLIPIGAGPTFTAFPAELTMSSQPVVAADPILCHCFKVRQSTVVDCVTLLGATCMQDIRAACGAGSGCMACRRRIQNLIDQKKQPRITQE